MSATVPAAFSSANMPAPAPIAFPSRAATEERARLRAGADNTAYQRQCDRIAQLVGAAHAEGHAAGHQLGYVQGWRWGVTCGACAAGLVAACTWALWAQAIAPWFASIGWP